MRYLFLTVTLFVISSSVSAQQSDLLSISAEGSVELPADIIQFNINLNAEADSPKEAYSLHQKREQALVELLDRYDIDEKDIRLEPIGINKSNGNVRYNEGKPTYQTRQAVSVKFTDFDIYGTIQVALIEEGFDSFNGSFLSTESENGKDEALKKAINIAKEKALLIAREAGVELGSIKGLSYSHNQYQPVYARSQNMVAMESTNNALLKYEQVITVTATISIEFAIIN